MACHDTLLILAQNIDELIKEEKDLKNKLILKSLSTSTWKALQEHTTEMGRERITVNKKCHVCGVSVGEKHKAICSVGPDVFKG